MDWSRAHVVVANHQSIIDICAMLRALPVPLHFVIKREMARVPFLGWYTSAMGMVFVQRGSARDAARRTREGADLVRGGATLCVFPEGTRSLNGMLAPFKSGAFQVAVETGVDIVPVTIEGSAAVIDPRYRFRVRHGPIVVTIGAPLPSTTHRNTLAAQARQRIAETLAQRNRN